MKNVKCFLVTLLLCAMPGLAQFFDMGDLPDPHEYGNVLIERLAKEGGGHKAVGFSHWLHRMEYTCTACHVELNFEMKANATEITEEDNRNGEYCGACHNGKTAFDHTSKDNCDKCHTGSAKTPKKIFKKRTSRLLRESCVSKNVRDSCGNEINWSESVRSGKIKPRHSVFDDEYEPMTYEDRTRIKAKWAMVSPAYFPHSTHRLWADCTVCHPALFSTEKEKTKGMQMDKILDGEYCGACHKNVAFPLQDCKRCHPDSRM